MADREKLIKLLYEPFLQNKINELSDTGDIADHLISHGVTVRERGRWEFHGGDDDMNLYGFCPKCHANWDEEIMEKFNFCPHCGADMRGEEDGT